MQGRTSRALPTYLSPRASVFRYLKVEDEETGARWSFEYGVRFFAAGRRRAAGAGGIPTPPCQCSGRYRAVQVSGCLANLSSEVGNKTCTLTPMSGISRAVAVHAVASEASSCAMAWHGVACLARSGLQSLQSVSAARSPLCAARGTSPQLCTPWLRTPSACCARVGPCGALMRLRAQ